ncbi:hypothetical protein GOODEAATRI_019682 [Goodea atripinnis]|uniref:Uncharacterized protein n=1 Tax=Goodea atripinnis TaxID=208336 RepID=A0ABV0NC07_9TELE
MLSSILLQRTCGFAGAPPPEPGPDSLGLHLVLLTGLHASLLPPRKLQRCVPEQQHPAGPQTQEPHPHGEALRRPPQTALRSDPSLVNLRVRRSGSLLRWESFHRVITAGSSGHFQGRRGQSGALNQGPKEPGGP